MNIARPTQAEIAEWCKKQIDGFDKDDRDIFQDLDPKLRDIRKIPDHVNVHQLCDPHLSAEEYSRLISECEKVER